jgi:bifunctional non-homologous end joining protein LigD
MKRTSARYFVSTIKGSKPGPMPGFIRPQLATLRTKVPEGGHWLHEMKFDGYRVQAHLKKGLTTLYTRRGHDWTHQFGNIAGALDYPLEAAILDGEVIVEKDGRTNFSELQAELAAGKKRRLHYYVFDLLYFDGFDLRDSPQIGRKRALELVLREVGVAPPIFYSAHFPTDGRELFQHACKLGLEGTISKLASAPYRSDRNEHWIKNKCIQRGKFPIVGFVKEPAGIAALYLGKQEGKEISYIGKVGTGFTRKTSSEIRKRLNEIIVPNAMLTKPIRKPKATWVKPKYFAAVDYRDITSEGYLRHSSFQGLFASETSTTNLTSKT